MPKQKGYNTLVTLLSAVLLGVVAFLYLGPKLDIEGLNTQNIPTLNAFINGATFVTLLYGLYLIKNKRVEAHRKAMSLALILSVLFLVFYVLYHSTQPSTPFGGEGAIRYLYFIILLTHIVLAAVMVPLVLITYTRALSERFDKHRKIARITLPIWLYVSFTGVVVYWMISPYY